MCSIVLIYMAVASILCTVTTLISSNTLSSFILENLFIFCLIQYFQPCQSVREDIITAVRDQSLIFDCLTTAFSLFQQTTPIVRSELEKRGFEDLVKRIEKRKDELPESLQRQLILYFEKKKLDKKHMM